MAYRVWLLLAFLVAFVIAGIAPTNRQDWVLEHLLTAVLIGLLAWYERRFRPLSWVSYTLLFVFLLMHVVGAHYLYSFVPYLDWLRSLGAESLAESLDTERNHYDRLVHLVFGMCFLMPIAEIVQRHVTPSRGWTMVVSIAFIGVLSKLYELAEWAIAVFMSPEAAESYNGQQGDMFDPQKDMALALVGSMLSAAFVVARLEKRRRRSGSEPAA